MNSQLELGEEVFVKADRSFFKNNPDESFYLRERFNDELMPDSPPYVVVFNLGKGMRFRIPFYKSTLSDEDIKQIKKECKEQFDAIKKLKSKSKPKLRLKKNKGFGKK